MEYAGVIFLLVIGEKDSWPNKRRVYERYGLYDGLKDIGEIVKSEVGDKVQKMIRLLEELDSLRNQTKL